MENNIIDILKDGDIIVTESSYKTKILEKLNSKDSFLDVTFMTKNEFLSKYYFSYDERAVYYLMDKYNLKEDIVRVYLDNLYYVSDKDYNNKKLNNLVNIKKELIFNNLLLFDDLFRGYINNKRIIFYNYNFFNKFELNMIEDIKNITNVVIVDKTCDKYIPDVYEFDTIFEEVDFVAKSILKLIEEGISPSLIKITNVSDDYIDVLDFIFTLYGLKTDINNSYLISNSIAQEFLSLNDSISETIALLNKKYNSSDVLGQIVKIVNKYVVFDNREIINEMISNEFKRTKIKKEKYDNLIEVIDYRNYPIDEEYVFMLGFNQGSIPVQYKDEEYITDDLKDDLLLDKTVDKNKKEKESTISNILNINNLVITYKKSTPFGSFFPSNLISDMNLSVIKGFKCDDIYSLDYSKILYAKELDNYVLYGSVSDNLKRYSSTLDISYNKYDNRFKGIDNNNLLSMFGDGFNLSYSSMNDYYKCSFKYYLSNVLNLNIFEDTFATYVGSLFHYVLEKGLLNEVSVSSLVEEFINNNERVLDAKEKFFVNNMMPDIEFALSTIKNNLKYTDLKKFLFEEKVSVTKNDKVTVTFKGFIDKIMYDEFDGKTIIAIVDYKTGYTDINLGYVPFGLSMQLPVYLYLASNIESFNNITFGGFYLQKVLPSKPIINIKKDVDSLKRESLLLYGYSNSDKDILKRVDNTYVDSNVIRSMKLKKDGEFSSYSKVLNDDEINNLIKLTDKKINDAVSSICNGEFTINPKSVNNKNLGCLYCKYKDICFVKKRDEVEIKPFSDLSFLGGEENA